MLLNWSPNSVTVRIDAKAPGWIVLNRNWARGWVAESPYEASDYQGLIAAHVGPGTHSVRFAYRPTVVLIGFAVSAMSLAVVSGTLVHSSRRLRRPKPGPSATGSAGTQEEATP